MSRAAFAALLQFQEEKTVNSNLYKINEVTQHKYYQVPKELYTNPRYKTTINNDAKMLYALLLDRMELSRANNWVDSDGTIFLIFKREDLADMLGICTTTVWRAIKQLKEVGHIAEIRQGLNKPNLIYIGKIDYSVPEQPKNSDENSDNSSDSKAIPTDIEKLNVRTFNNSTSGVLNDKCQDFEKVNTNKTDINNLNKNNTDFNETESKKYKAEQKNSSFVNSSQTMC